MKLKRILEGVFLSFLTGLSLLSTAYSLWMIRNIRKITESADFIDIAAKSLESAAALLNRRDQYEHMLKYSVIALAVCAILLAVWIFVTRKANARPASSET